VAGSWDVLIVGGGQGGAQAALRLRQHGFAGSVAILGDEIDPPYERPPLSKEYLCGEKSFERLLFRTEAGWGEAKIDLLLGRRAIAVDPGARRVTTADGDVLAYGCLIWSAGAAARRLGCPGEDLAGVHSIRSRADVDRLRDDLGGVDRVVLIGGGFIGLEAAAVLTKLGKRVTVLESRDRVLARVAGETLSRFYEAEHRARGVEIRSGVQVARLLPSGDRVAGVELAGGEIVSAGMVVVAIGIVPATAPLSAAGAAGDAGLFVDQRCRTSLPGIYAIGDCAEQANPFAGGARIRLESVPNANDQASQAASAICGRAELATSVPWFWSNQFDLKLQTAGLNRGFDAAVVRGDPAGRSFSVVYLREGRVVALDCVNAVRDYTHGKALILARVRPDPNALGDPGVPLKAHLPGAVK
jgi:3-phenylpropionate/trans-cinnamate dioxygenase ferredoxin reductase subunit